MMFARMRNHRPDRRASHSTPPSTLSPATANAAAPPPPLVSPLQMTFDFERAQRSSHPGGILDADVRSASPSLFRPSADSNRPRTSDGLGAAASASRKSAVGMTPPVLPPIPRVASRRESMKSGASQESLNASSRPTSAKGRPLPRDESDNVSTTSRSSRKSLRLPSLNNKTSADRLQQEQQHHAHIDMMPTSTPASGSGVSFGKGNTSPEQPRSSGSSGNTPQMESSLFPKRETPLLPHIDTGPPMSRAFIDSRDRGYAPPQARPQPLESSLSSPDIYSLRSLAASPGAYTARTPLSPLTAASPSSPSVSLRAPQISGARLSPSSSVADLREQMQRQELPRTFSQPSLSLPYTTQTDYSGSTARPSTQASSSASTAARRDSPAPYTVIGTPYGATSNSFPLPQHVATRPKTAGATSTVAGISVPTHHTHSPRQETATMPTTTTTTTNKADRRKTRMLNPMNLLVRRRSGQDPAQMVEDRSVQAEAFARQKSVAMVGINRLPDNFDPRIRGKVVHDFSAPRQQRNFSYNGADIHERQGPLHSAFGAPSVPALVEEGERELQQQRRSDGMEVTHSKQASESSSASGGGLKSVHSPMFREMLTENPNASKRVSSLNAERLENKDFLQRASHQSSVSTFSQESAVLPPFARRSQQFTLDPLQAAFVQDHESKRSSDPSSQSGSGGGGGGGGGKARDSGMSGVSMASGVSPITARSSGGAPAQEVRASLSPISPASPMEKVAGRPPSTVDMNATNVPLSPELRARSQSELTARPYSVVLERNMVETIQEHPTPSERPASDTPAVSNRDSAFAPEAVHVPPRDSVDPAEVSMMHLPISERGSSLGTPDLSTPELTPEIREAETATILPVNRRASQQSPTRQLKVIEKRASAAGHSNRTKESKVSKHVSNASRFSFQFGNESAVEEQKLMEKHQRVTRQLDETERRHLKDRLEDEEEDYFDEDAINDMDEMEIQGQRQEEVQGSSGVVEPVQAPASALAGVQQALHPAAEESEEDGSVYDDEDEVPDLREVTYAEHPDFRLHSAMGWYSGTASQQSWRGAPEQQAAVSDGHAQSDGPAGRPPGMSAASQLTVITNTANMPAAAPASNAAFVQDTFSRSGSMPGGVGGARPRSGFYMQPQAAGYSPSAGSPEQSKAKPALPHRNSGNSERNRVASGLSFGSSNGEAMRQSVLSASSAAASHSSKSEGQRVTSQSTVGGSSTSGARTTSTGLGLSGFSEFRFSDSPSPNLGNSRPTSPESSIHDGAYGKRTTVDSETIPSNTDWNDFKKHMSMGTPPSHQWLMRSSYLSSPDRNSAAYRGALGKHVREHNGSMSQTLPYAESEGLEGNGEDDMYFDDGGFEQDIKLAHHHHGSVDEDAFDNDNYLNGSARATRAVGHERAHSVLAVGNLGSAADGGPYPSFALPPQAVMARQRQSQMLLEDLPLHAPVDPKWIPQRNPSEDAKRLGLSSRVPPLPPQPGSKEAVISMQRDLQAYHSALAEAVNKAAAEGRFLRQPSVSSTARSLSAYSKAQDDDNSDFSYDDRSHYSCDENGEDMLNIPENSAAGVNRRVLKERSGSKRGEDKSHSASKLMDFDFGFNSHPAQDGDDAAAAMLYGDDEEDDDDDIVAAANAEVLASDDEGFYGQEFGFYAKARAKPGDLQPVNGGFFGEDGDDGLRREKSLKEPNLTPITERSEFSARNSFIGIGHAAPFAPSQNVAAGVSPVTLARLPVSPLMEEEVVSFDQLRKLRANAFGGSNGSLKSEARGPVSGAYSWQTQSPASMSARSSGAAPGSFSPMGGAPMAFEYNTDSSASNSNPSSAHLQMQIQSQTQGMHENGPQQQQQQQQRLHLHDSPQSAMSSAQLPFAVALDPEATPKKAQSATMESSPVTARKVSKPVTTSTSTTNGQRHHQHHHQHHPHQVSHSRKGSGADSVTYVQERDPETQQPKWVLERRRTSEQGQLELIGREVVQGGWI